MTRKVSITASWAAFLVGAFLYRLAFGLCGEFFWIDETQILLIGLRHHATGAWPYFGPDVTWSRSEIPGALQGLLVGIPLDIVPVPEAPFVLLNLLSFGALVLLAWYVKRRLPELPRWLVYGWLFFIPWTLSFSTHLLNSDYVLAPAILFFVGFFEAFPRFRINAVRLPIAYALMGLGLCGVMQFHMSWPLLGPFALLVIIARLREGPRSAIAAAGWMLAGAAVTGAFVLPTFLKFGLAAGGGGVHRNVAIHPRSPVILLSTIAQFCSFSSIEVPRFIGASYGHTLQLLHDHWWMVPLTLLALVAGTLQPFWMLASWARRKTVHDEWPALKWLVAGTIVLIYVAYWFVITDAMAHAFYLLAPLSFIYAFYCFSAVDSRRARKVAGVLLATTIAYNAGLALVHAPERSLYRNREAAAVAIRDRNPEVFGHRRDFSVEGAPAVNVVATGEELGALSLSKANNWREPGGYLLWNVTVTNNSTKNAYRNVNYDTIYRNSNGVVVQVRTDVVYDILQPGQSLTLTGVNQGFVPDFKSAEMKITSAIRLLPLRDVHQALRARN